MPQRQLRFMFEDAAGPAARKRREEKEAQKKGKKFPAPSTEALFPTSEPLQVFIIHN